MKSVLLQCVGAVSKVDPFFTRGTIDTDETFVLCCDGFWRKTSQSDFEKIMTRSEQDTEDQIEAALKDHIEWLKKNGENDNISAILVRARDAI